MVGACAEDGLEDASQSSCIQSARRATTYIYSMYGFGGLVLADLPLREQRLDILGLLLQVGRGEEVAVFTTTLAKWNMYVYARHQLRRLLLEGLNDAIGEWLEDIEFGVEDISVGHGCNAPSLGRTPDDDTTQTIGVASMADRIVARCVVFWVVDKINKLLQAQSVLVFPWMHVLNHPYRCLHGFGTLLADDTHAVELAIVHVHLHVLREVLGGNLHTASR